MTVVVPFFKFICYFGHADDKTQSYKIPRPKIVVTNVLSDCRMNDRLLDSLVELISCAFALSEKIHFNGGSIKCTWGGVNTLLIPTNNFSQICHNRSSEQPSDGKFSFFDNDF